MMKTLLKTALPSLLLLAAAGPAPAAFQLLPEHPILSQAPTECLGVRHIYLHPGYFHAISRPFGNGIAFEGRLSHYLSKTMLPSWGVRIQTADPKIQVTPSKQPSANGWLDLIDRIAREKNLCVTVDWTHHEIYVAEHKDPPEERKTR